MRRWIYVGTGIILCSAAAAALTALMLISRSPVRTFLPLMFLLVILLVALRFGSVAGMLGTVASAIIFAEFLFDPRFSLVVRDSAGRSNLIWMLIAGVALSELFGRRPTEPPTRSSNMFVRRRKRPELAR